MVLVPNFGVRSTISSNTQLHPQHFRNHMRVHWECAWCQCQISVLAPAYSTLPKYARRCSETSCVSTEYVPGDSAKYWFQNHRIQHYTNTPIAIKKLHVCPLGISVVLVPNICISTSISNSTKKRPQQFRNFMCVHRECVWCQCQILVLEPPYPKLHKYTHSNSETSFVCTGNVRGASAKFWSYKHHIQQYINTPTALQKLNVLPLRNVRGANAKYLYQHHHIQQDTKTPSALQKLHACALGMCVVLVPNICISTSISNSTQKRPQHFRNFMHVHWECAWCQCQILVLEPPYPTLHKHTRSN